MTVRDELQRLAEAIGDGTATPADRERLEALLAGSPAAREVWADLEAAQRALAGAGLDAPPPDLHASILRAVAEAPTAASNLPAWWQALLRTFAVPPASRVAWGLAALLAVSVLVVAALTGQFGAGRELGPSAVATLSPGGGSDASPPAGTAGGSPGPGPRVEASAVREPHAIRVRVEVRDASGSDVAVTWPADDAVISGFRWTRGDGDAPSLEAGRVIVHIANEATFEFELSPTGAATPELRLVLRSGGREQVVPLRISAR